MKEFPTSFSEVHDHAQGDEKIAIKLYKDLCQNRIKLQVELALLEKKMTEIKGASKRNFIAAKNLQSHMKWPEAPKVFIKEKSIVVWMEPEEAKSILVHKSNV